MKQRCLNPNSKNYLTYGHLGINVDDRWLGPYGFRNFLEDLGDRPAGMTLDRIDNRGNYCKANCKWSSSKEQNRNRNYCLMLEYRGEVRNLMDWCELLGVNHGLVRNRLKRGWPADAALSISPGVKYRRKDS